MNLADYIKKVGAEEFAKRFGVKPRTAYSYQLGDRLPRAETAQKIVAETPVTWEGIYGSKAKAS
jgi:transcriptional regulator with XRE-family HTH domain